jgi:hypothetical protein
MRKQIGLYPDDPFQLAIVKDVDVFRMSDETANVQL